MIPYDYQKPLDEETLFDLKQMLTEKRIPFADNTTKPEALAMLAAHKPFDLSRLTKGKDIAAGDYSVTFVVDKLIPENAIILDYGKGGCGKSTLKTQMAGAIVSGKPFMGLDTLKRPVVIIDYENPPAVLKERVKALGGDPDDVYFWTTENTPPQMTKDEWQDLKSLVVTLVNPVLIFDTLSSSCSDLDILSNKDFSPVMHKMKELRGAGATIILLHHTPKQDETKYIGASCIYNQVDHVLAMYPVRGTDEEREVVDEDQAKIYRWGTKDKTRFKHHAIYVEFDEDEKCFVEARDPDHDILDRIKKLVSEQQDINQTGIINQIGTTVSQAKIKRLLNHNEDKLWTVERGEKNAKIYRPIPVIQLFSPIGVKNRITENQLSDGIEKRPLHDTTKALDGIELASFLTHPKKHEKQDDPDSMPVFDF